MADQLADDVKELLDNGHGDKQILAQILRACKNDEVVSNYERSYVRKLAEKHLGKRPEPDAVNDAAAAIVQAPTPFVPDVYLTEQPVIARPVRKNTKYLAVIGVVIALVVTVLVSLYAVSGSDVDIVNGNTDGTGDGSTDTPRIRTDLQSYRRGDLISISGTAGILGSASLSITNPEGIQVWSDQVTVKDNYAYSSLAIAGGTGWTESGTFTITVQDNTGSASSTFSFTR